MQTAEQNLELWFTRHNWIHVMLMRNFNRVSHASGSQFIPLFTGDRRNITTREEGEYVVVRMWGFIPNGHGEVPDIPHIWQHLAERLVDLRNNETIKGKVNTDAG